MKAYNYIRYFFYLGINWNFRLAAFIIWHEIRGERQYGIDTSYIDDLRQALTTEQLEHASIYQPVNFYTAKKLMAQLLPTQLQTGFLDVGCGMGRLLAMAAYMGFKDIYGIDFATHLCQKSLALARQLHPKFTDTRFTISCIGAADYAIPTNVGVIFIFNPFNEIVMQQFVLQIEYSLQLCPRSMTILYANPVCKQVLQLAGFVEIYYFKKMEYLEGSVLTKTPRLA